MRYVTIAFFTLAMGVATNAAATSDIQQMILRQMEAIREKFQASIHTCQACTVVMQNGKATGTTVIGGGAGDDTCVLFSNFSTSDVTVTPEFTDAQKETYSFPLSVPKPNSPGDIVTPKGGGHHTTYSQTTCLSWNSKAVTYQGATGMTKSNGCTGQKGGPGFAQQAALWIDWQGCGTITHF